MWISGLRPRNSVWSWISASVHRKWWWQCWNIIKFAPDESHECSHRNKKNVVCMFVRTYWTNMRLKVTVSQITPLLVTGCGVITGVKTAVHGVLTWIPQWIKIWRLSPQQVKWCALSFWDRKEVIPLDFLEPRQTINSDCYIMTLTQLKAWTSSQAREENNFSLATW